MCLQTDMVNGKKTYLIVVCLFSTSVSSDNNSRYTNYNYNYSSDFN